jgi:hypothetical protein
MVKLFGECFAKLVKHRLPRRERRRVWKPLNHSAVAVEELALNARQAEGSPAAIRAMPSIEHFILDDQTAALALKRRWRLLVISARRSPSSAQCDASG